MPYPKEFRPEAPDDLVRVGGKFDGGYVLPERILDATRAVLSFGLSDEFEFERELARRKPVAIVCFDHTVTGAFWLRKVVANIWKGVARGNKAQFLRAFRFVRYLSFFNRDGHLHVRKALGYPGAGALSFKDALDIAAFDKAIFPKMDIEGWEYRLLPEIVVERERFVGMAIEFHDVDLHEQRIAQFLRDVSASFLLVHFHANSHAQVGPGGQSIVIEVTLTHRSLLRAGEALKARRLPIAGLDAPNIPGQREAAVVFADI